MTHDMIKPILRSPDPTFIRSMKKIGIIYFGVEEEKKQKSRGGLMGLIQNIMSDLGATDSDEGMTHHF